MKYRSIKQVRWANSPTGRKALGAPVLKAANRYIKGKRFRRLPLRVKK